MTRRALAWLLLALWLTAIPGLAQNGRDTQRKLDNARQQLKQVAAERRKLEGERGAAQRALRAADEQVAASARALAQTRARLTEHTRRLDELQRRQSVLNEGVQQQRSELAGLLRAAYAVGDAAPLKLLLAQDSVAAANRAMAYHAYLQRERAARIRQLRGELAEITALEQEVRTAQEALLAERRRQQTDAYRLARDRTARADTVARIDRQYTTKTLREAALGRDVKSLEKVLAQLRTAARRAEAERRAAARQTGSTSKAEPGRTGTRARPAAAVVANAQPVRVGGLGWPLSGTLLAGYGGALPDGRKSSGLLIAASVGTPVRAVANGKVVFAEWMNGYGLISIVDHGGGYLSLYAHNDALLREVGADVKRGDPVASVGSSGGQGRAALYFELRRNGQPVNPSSWLSARK